MDTITVDLFFYLRPPPPPLPQRGSVTTPLESCGFFKVEVWLGARASRLSHSGLTFKM